MANTREQIKKILIKNIELGNSVMKACENANINRDTFYAWYRSDKNFREEVEKAKLSRCIILEEAMFKSALEGNVTMQIFLACNWMPDKYKNLHKIENKLESEQLEKSLEKIAQLIK